MNVAGPIGSEYCNLHEVLKLIGEPFSGDKGRLREFIDNADEAAFELTEPGKHDRLLKFNNVGTQGNGSHNLGTRRIIGAQALIDHLAKTCFVQGPRDEHVQLVVHSKGLVVRDFGDAVEVALEEEINPEWLKQKSRVRAIRTRETRAGKYIATNTSPARSKNREIGYSRARISNQLGNTLGFLQMDIETRKEVKLLKDTGSEISLLNANLLTKKTTWEMNNAIRYTLQGISQTEMRTHSYAPIQCRIGSMLVAFTYHGIASYPYDGIIGRDFLVREGTVIDYPRNTVYLGKRNISMPLVGSGIIKILQQIVLKGRSYKLAFTRLENKARIRRVKESLGLGHLNKEEWESVRKLCKEYCDIFHLRRDKLSWTPTVEHNIPTMPGAQSMNMIQYRIPQVHKEEVERQEAEILRDGIIEPSTSL
ncbi:hypothetical protein PR048_009257 [Dryococelus australis]|uniref:Peptidase A2 domain-containing protein n=1 Tax=Dryococelus australis TaxID=614101 RepID=A0ABQ9HZG0_9NEOP|nr:hypothetical protein PR048_009257 [Dryococelus australis]